MFILTTILLEERTWQSTVVTFFVSGLRLQVTNVLKYGFFKVT